MPAPGDLHPSHAVFPDPSNDPARSIDELRRILYKLGAPGMSRADAETLLRRDAVAQTFLARLRRSGMSDAAVTSAVFDAPNADG